VSGWWARIKGGEPSLRERFSWGRPATPGTSLSEDRAAMARTFAYLFGIGATLLLFTLALQHDSHRSVPGLLVAAALAYATTAFFILGYDRLPLRLFKVSPAFGGTLVSVVLFFGGASAVSAYAMYFFWVALAAAYFFDFRVAMTNVAIATVLYASVLQLRPEVQLPLLHWVMGTGALFVASILMVQLRHHAEAAVTEADRVKAEFFALVSHELRTPLTSITGYLDLVRHSKLPETRRDEFLGVIDRNSRRLLRLVGDLLFVAQVQASGVEFERFELDLAEVARESVQTFRARASREGLDLRSEIVDVGVSIGDAGRIGQAIDNVVSNAIKFTPRGGTIWVRLARQGEDRALIEIADTGMGISESEQANLFEHFYRAREARSKLIEGTGLGLAIVKTIVEGHDGEISFHSRERVGTTVRLSLPLPRPAGSQAPGDAGDVTERDAAPVAARS
jgi:signal transduction histidine kinase